MWAAVKTKLQSAGLFAWRLRWGWTGLRWVPHMCSIMTGSFRDIHECLRLHQTEHPLSSYIIFNEGLASDRAVLCWGWRRSCHMCNQQYSHICLNTVPTSRQMNVFLCLLLSDCRRLSLQHVSEMTRTRLFSECMKDLCRFHTQSMFFMFAQNKVGFCYFIWI